MAKGAPHLNHHLNVTLVNEVNSSCDLAMSSQIDQFLSLT